MVLTREQQQFTLNLLAEIYGNQIGAELTFTLKDGEDANNDSEADVE